MTRPPVIMQWALTTTAVMARDGGGSVSGSVGS
jgi:hypothetical protein